MAGRSEFDRVTRVGGGKVPDDTWGFINVSWPFLRVRLGAAGVRLEPSFLRNWIIFRIPSWEATWDELSGVSIDGSHVVLSLRRK